VDDRDRLEYLISLRVRAKESYGENFRVILNQYVMNNLCKKCLLFPVCSTVCDEFLGMYSRVLGG